MFGAVADRIGGLWTLLIGSAGQVVMLVGFIVVESLLGLYLVAGLFGLVYGGIVPCYAIIVRELFPLRQVGWRIGIVFLFGTIGMALGGWLGGQIFDLTGSYHSAFLVGVGVQPRQSRPGRHAAGAPGLAPAPARGGVSGRAPRSFTPLRGKLRISVAARGQRVPRQRGGIQ